MSFMRIIASALVLVFATKTAFRTMILYTVMVPEYFQMSSWVDSAGIMLLLVLGFLFPAGLVILTFLKAKRINFISNKSLAILSSAVFLMLQLMCAVSIFEIFDGSVIEGVAETIRSISLLSLCAFIPFLGLFFWPHRS